MPAILIPIDSDNPVTPEHEAYWLALGHFIHRFARIEQQIAYTLSIYSGVPKETARAVFSGVRAKDAFSLIDRIREVRAMPEDPDWVRAKCQFGAINSVRNDIVHLGAIKYPEGFKISNRARTIPSLVKTTPISVTDLDAMTADLTTISHAVYVHQLLELGYTDENRSVRGYRELGRAPWQYKPPPQAPSQGKRGKRKGKQQPPPPSSEA